MTYEDLELNQFFTKSSTIFQTLPDNEFDAFVDNISANKINRGIAIRLVGKLVMATNICSILSR